MRLLALLAAAASLAAAADSKEFRKTVPLDANGRFSLDTYKGSIHIAAWDQPQADIEARIVEDSGPWAVPVESVDIRVDASSREVRVKTDYHRHFSLIEGSLPNVYYTIRVPRGASLTIEDYKSESDISGVQGDIDFHTYKGTARLKDLDRAVNLRTYKGDISASYNKFSAGTRIETYKGTVDLSLPRASAFEINAQLQRHATLDCDFPRTIRSGRRETEVRGAVNGGGPQLRVTSYRGSIRIRAI